jgi:DNA-binding transcriptional LysR family regulator
LLARRIGSVGIRLFAHRSYCARRGVPASLGETEGHLLIGRPEHLAQLPADAPRLHFGFRCNSDLGLLAAMRAGVGIGYCQAPIALRDPDLLAVLPELELARLEVWLVTHEDLRPVRRVRVLMEFLAERLAAYVDG